MFGNSYKSSSLPGSRSITETVELGEISRKKMNKIGKPKLVKTFKDLIANENEIMQESSFQMVMIVPKNIFGTNQDLKRFFDEYVATTLCNAQKQLATLKITGQIGGLVRKSCKGKN